MPGPIRRISNMMVVTSPYGPRGHKFHKGVDLRSIRFLPGKGFVPQWSLQDVIATEESKVLRSGADGYGNGFLIVKPLSQISIQHNYTELKYIHITIPDFRIGDILLPGDYIGKTTLDGNSKAHHVHWETWKEDSVQGKYHVNPLEYFYIHDIPWRMKN